VIRPKVLIEKSEQSISQTVQQLIAFTIPQSPTPMVLDCLGKLKEAIRLWEKIVFKFGIRAHAMRM
jgi:hypothetical protein